MRTPNLRHFTESRVRYRASLRPSRPAISSNPSDELRAIVGTDMLRNTLHDHHIGQRLDHLCAAPSSLGTPAGSPEPSFRHASFRSRSRSSRECVFPSLSATALIASTTFLFACASDSNDSNSRSIALATVPSHVRKSFAVKLLGAHLAQIFIHIRRTDIVWLSIPIHIAKAPPQSAFGQSRLCV